MKRTCPMCGRSLGVEEFFSPGCGRCEKIAGDVDAELLLVCGLGYH
jgi:hypothetical protein